MARRIKKPPHRYHHGNLREALVAAALRITEESGPEAVTVREAARRAGVSPSAPFRHFPDRTALLTAVAEDAIQRFVAEIARTEQELPADAEPVRRFRAIGLAYLRFAIQHPQHFRVMHALGEAGYERSPLLRGANDTIRLRMEALIEEGQQKGVMSEGDPRVLRVTAHALVRGLAQLWIDGMLEHSGLEPAEQTAAMEQALDVLGHGLYARPAPP